MGILVQEEWVNKSQGLRSGESDVYETWCDTIGELFLAMQREYGRCISKVYIGEGTPIGWVFEKRETYDRSNETFLLHTWITVHKSKPVKTIEFDYLEM